LIFPVYSGRRAGAIRVSEQEARFVFTESLATTPYFYSVEAPTSEGYKLTGSKPMSAQTDLTIYDHNRQAILNVEFKAKGFSTSARSLFSLEKDFQKLLREPITGMWFHILEAVDNSTILKLFDAIAEALYETADKFQNDVKETQLIFHFCILRQRFSLHKRIVLDSENNTLESLKRQFRFSYTLNRSVLIEINDANGWCVYGLE